MFQQYSKCTLTLMDVTQICDHIKASPGIVFSIRTSLIFLIYQIFFTFLLKLLLFHIHSEYLLSYECANKQLLAHIFFIFSKLLLSSVSQISLRIVFSQGSSVLMSLICVLEHGYRGGDGSNTTGMAVSESVIKLKFE